MVGQSRPCSAPMGAMSGACRTCGRPIMPSRKGFRALSSQGVTDFLCCERWRKALPRPPARPRTLTWSNTMGCPPTDLKARTGELTPPGSRSCASLKICGEQGQGLGLRGGSRCRAAAPGRRRSLLCPRGTCHPLRDALPCPSSTESRGLAARARPQTRPLRLGGLQGGGNGLGAHGHAAPAAAGHRLGRGQRHAALGGQDNLHFR